MSNKYSFLTVTLIVTATCALALSSRAQTTNDLVNDTWQDGTRTDPAAPVYAENNGVVGTDADTDGDLESVWYRGGGGNIVTTPGHLLLTNSTSSTSFTTFFTPEASKVTLTNPGDTIQLKWTFIPNGVNTSNTSQGLPLAIVNTPNGSRLSADGSPTATSAYAGYSMFLNMGNQFNSSSPFELREWNASGTALLGTSGNWNILTNQTAKGLHGYDSGTQYTFVMDLTRDASGSLDINATMSGGTIGGGGVISMSYTDSTPNSFTYDTFAMRSSAVASTATNFDTTLFQVQFITVPEPSTVMLVGAGLGLMLGLIRRRRS